MNNTVKPIPEDYRSVTPYLTVHDADAALAFYADAFGAIEELRLNMPNGKIAHAEFKIGGSHFMISDEYPNPNSTSPQTLGGSAVKLRLFVEDVDAAFSRAVAAGAQSTMPVADQFWGDRMGALTDPFGHHWLISTHIEDVDQSEYQPRMDAFFAKQRSFGD